jgi:hypothetical protein
MDCQGERDCVLSKELFSLLYQLTLVTGEGESRMTDLFEGQVVALGFNELCF